MAKVSMAEREEKECWTCPKQVPASRATERGELDVLPRSGEPLELTDHYDPDWWFKSLVKREQLAILPLSVELRREESQLDEVLDRPL